MAALVAGLLLAARTSQLVLGTTTSRLTAVDFDYRDAADALAPLTGPRTVVVTPDAGLAGNLLVAGLRSPCYCLEHPTWQPAWLDAADTFLLVWDADAPGPGDEGLRRFLRDERSLSCGPGTSTGSVALRWRFGVDVRRELQYARVSRGVD